jgi:hypothetical protein
MLHIKGGYIVVRESIVTAHILTESAINLYNDRLCVVGELKACQATFGDDAILALPTHIQKCMETIALELPVTCERDRMLKAFCACVILGKPFPNGSDNLDGGMKVMADKDKPKPRKPRDGAAVKAPQSIGAN